jgi:hypothetical protein
MGVWGSLSKIRRASLSRAKKIPLSYFPEIFIRFLQILKFMQ